MTDWQEFLERESEVKDFLAESFSTNTRMGYGVLFPAWAQWLGNYYIVGNRRYSLNDELSKAKKLAALSNNQIEVAVYYLEFISVKDADISDDSWNDFIINRRNAGTKPGTK